MPTMQLKKKAANRSRKEPVVTLGSLTLSLEYVDTERAEEYLGHIGMQRKISDSHVAMLANEMKRGHWQFTSEAIKFDEQGHLIDGQQRLRAVIESDKPQTFLVIRGEKTSVFDVLDQGLIRSVAQILRMRGEQHYAILAAAARLVYLWDEDAWGSKQRKRVTPRDVADVLRTHPHLRMAVSAWGKSSKLNQISLPSVNTFMFYEFWIRSADRAEEFMSEVEQGGKVGSASKLLFDRLLTEKLKDRNMGQREYITLWIKAWNEYMQGNRAKPMKQLRYKKSEELPVIADTWDGEELEQ